MFGLLVESAIPLCRIDAAYILTTYPVGSIEGVSHLLWNTSLLKCGWDMYSLFSSVICSLWWSIWVKSFKTTTWRWQLSFWRIISKKGCEEPILQRASSVCGASNNISPKDVNIYYTTLFTHQRENERRSQVSRASIIDIGWVAKRKTWIHCLVCSLSSQFVSHVLDPIQHEIQCFT